MISKKVVIWSLAIAWVSYSNINLYASFCEAEKEALNALEKGLHLDSNTFEEYLSLATHVKAQKTLEQIFREIEKLKQEEKNENALFRMAYGNSYVSSSFEWPSEAQKLQIERLRSCIELQHTLLNQLLKSIRAYPHLEAPIGEHHKKLLSGNTLGREAQLRIILGYIPLTNLLEQDLEWILKWASEGPSEMVQVFESILSRIDLSVDQHRVFETIQSRWLGSEETAFNQLQQGLVDVQNDEVPLTEENLIRYRSLALDPLFRIRLKEKDKGVQLQLKFNNFLLRRLAQSRLPFVDLEIKITDLLKKTLRETQARWKDQVLEEFLITTPSLGENLGWAIEAIGKYEAVNYKERAFQKILSRKDLSKENLSLIFQGVINQNLFFDIWEQVASHDACTSELHQKMLQDLKARKGICKFRDYEKKIRKMKKLLKERLKIGPFHNGYLTPKAQSL